MVSSRLSSKVEIRDKSLNGRGIFAKEDIKKDEIVFIKGGHILTRDEIFSSGTINSYFPISDEYFLGAINKEEEEAIKLYQNHSCNPNVGLHGEITFVAMRDIKKDEELTVDYAFIDNEDYSFKCTCGSDNCRGIITGFDWKMKEIQDKYYEYFAQYLKDKIDKERKEKMKKIVISGSSKLQDKVEYWLHYFKALNYEILDYPKYIEPNEYEKKLPIIFQNFYTSLENTDVYFLMNEEKNGIKGYIGASSIAELTYVVILNLIHHKNIEIYILNMPSEEVSSYDEVKFWLDRGWIKIFSKKESS